MRRKIRHVSLSPAEAGPSASSARPKSPRVARLAEGWATALVVLAGIVQRTGGYRLSTVEHFDEGVYASNLLFGAESGYGYPLRHLYAPPLWPTIVEWTMILAGRMTGWAAVLPAWIVGCATVLAVWWLGRRWFGPVAALSAAILVAGSDVHSMFSLAVLTDVLLLGWMLLALERFARAAESQRWRDYALAGALTGCAWWTKYNGWLPLAVACPALFVVAVTRDGRTWMWRTWGGWAVACAAAITIWLPVLYGLQPVGGYAAVAANHSRYVVGLAGWPSSLTRQVANWQAVDGIAGVYAWGAAVLLAWALRRLTSRDEASGDRCVSWMECLCVLAFSLFMMAAAWWIGATLCSVVAGAVGLALRTRTAMRRGSANPPPAALWLLISWFACLLVLTPFYTPYLRLTLPLLGASWLASGLWLDSVAGALVHVSRDGSDGRGTGARLAGTLVVWVLSVAGVFVATRPPGPVTWREDRRGLERIAAEILATTRESPSSGRPASSDPGPVFYVYGEPALVFHLRALGAPAVVPVATLELEPARSEHGFVPTFLVAGLHAQQDPDFQAALAQVIERFDSVTSYPYRPSLLVQLDHGGPEHTDSEVTLYRVR
ncbi:MAG: ArnT family glycosyltransferase [Pirellulaceae bacterium]